MSLASSLIRDVRYSLRALRKTPAFTVGAVVTVALTVGATTAIFSVVYGVLLRQLPYRERRTGVLDLVRSAGPRSHAVQRAGFHRLSRFHPHALGLCRVLRLQRESERRGGGRARARHSGHRESLRRHGRAARGSAACCSPSDERPGAEHVVVLDRTVLDAAIWRRPRHRRPRHPAQ